MLWDLKLGAQCSLPSLPYSCAVSIGFVLFIFSYYSALKSLKIGETKQLNCEERPLAVSIVCFIMHLLYNSFSRNTERL